MNALETASDALNASRYFDLMTSEGTQSCGHSVKQGCLKKYLKLILNIP